jgi:DNA polymerase-3 subunit chi
LPEGSCEVWFYHLERSGLDQVLPELLEKTLARGWRALVRATSAERVDHLDNLLWTFRDDSFLPHGVTNEPMAERQPVLITQDAANTNGASVVFLVDGADAGDLTDLERCVLIFDGGDPLALEAARQAWARWKAEGRPIAYWKQGESGGWTKQA